MTQPIIDVDHVTKEFILGQPPSLRQTAGNLLRRMAGRPVDAPAPFKALDDISFQVAPGEVLGIIGHNGAGKSTLLKILARISQPTKGAVHVRGRVAPLIEVGAGLMPDMTGRENIFLNASILGMKKDEIRRRFDEIVEFAEIAEFVDTPVKRYSSGMRVKLGFSIATTVSSEILIVDEVLAVGDVAFQRKSIERMQALIRADDRTVLIVGHNIRQLERICTRMLLLEHGRIKLDGDAPEVTHQFFQDSAQRRPALSTEMRLRPTSTTGEIDLTELKVNNTELTDEEITAHSLAPLKVHIHLLSRIAAKDVEINIGAHTPEMNFVFKSSNLMAGRHIDLVCGDNVLEITIDRLALAPGSYGVGLGIYDWSRKPLWSGTGLAWLNVVPAPDVRCVLPSATLCLLPSSWQTSPIGATLKESLSIVSTNV